MNEYSTIIGMDLGDKLSHYAVMTRTDTDVEATGEVRTTEPALRRVFGAMKPSLITIEAGTHSPWVSRLLTDCGHEVIVANPRRTRAIYENPHKSDRVDAEMLARLTRSDPTLLKPIEHRTEHQQGHLAILKARDALVKARTLLINQVRGLVKSMGSRLGDVDADSFHKAASEHIPKALRCAVKPLLQVIGELTRKVKAYDKNVKTLAAKQYPACELFQSINGVGPITSLAFCLTIGDPTRFTHSRNVGAYLGLTRGRDQSGDSDPDLGITKAGDHLMRRLLVGCAQYIVGPQNNHDSELRQWGLRLAGPLLPNGKHDRKLKKRAVVAVARKLAVLMHTLWMTGMVYEPFFHSTKLSGAPDHAS